MFDMESVFMVVNVAMLRSKIAPSMEQIQIILIVKTNLQSNVKTFVLIIVMV